MYTTLKSVDGYYLRKETKFPIAKNLSQVVGVAYDDTNIYWTDISDQTESIVRSSIDGKRQELLLTSGLALPEDLVVDSLTGNIYFTDSLLMHIAVCSNDGYHCTSLIKEKLHKPRSIALHSQMGQMYWSDWGKLPMIGTSSMDGNDVKELVTQDIHWPNGITLDWPNNRLYWVDARLHIMESVTLDGKNRKTILNDALKHPYGIAVFDDQIYWSDWETLSIQSCNKFTGKDRKTVVRDKKMYDIHIYNSALTAKDNYICRSHPCSHLCLLNNNRTYTCACPMGMELSIDKVTCKDNNKKKSLLLGIGNYIALIEPQVFGRHHIGRGEPLPMFVNKIEFNSLNGLLFIADNIQGAIYTYNFITKESRDLITKGIGNVTAMSFGKLNLVVLKQID